MKRTIAIVVCVVVLLSAITTTYAINVNAALELNYYAGSYGTDPENHGTYLGTALNSREIWAYYRTEGKPVYAFTVNNILYFCSEYNDAGGSIGTTQGRSQGFGVLNNDYYNDTGLYYSVGPNDFGGQGITSSVLTNYNDIQTALDSIASLTPEESRSMTINLPAGNVAYIEIDNTYDQASFTVTMPTASYAIGTSPWPESNQQYFFTSTLPSVGNFDPQGTKINWLRNGKTTLAGITTQASASISGSASGTYLCVVNPAYYGGTANGPYEFLMNGTVSITVNGFVRVKIFQLESTLGLPADPTDHSQLVVNTAVTGTDYEGEVDEDTGNIIWTDNEEPVVGGGNLVTPSVSGFQSWLQGILDSIVNIFEPAHNAIQTLASAVSNFAGWLYALYIWLPSPVLSVLTSAITLAIIIGVVKVFI